MRSAAMLALGFLAVPLNSHIAGASQLDEVETAVSSIIETNEYTIVRLEAQCLECQATPYSSLPLELKVRKDYNACDVTGIYLNGGDLVHDWKGDSGYGSGSISALAGDFDAPVFASWESFCTPVPCDVSDGCMAQVLTVQLEHLGEAGFGSDIRFSITIFEDRKPEIKSLCNYPWHIFESSYSKHQGELIGWPDVELLSTNQVEEEEETLETLYTRLQNLKVEAHELQQQIQDQKRKIREKLAAGCPSDRNDAVWESCTTVPCRLEHSFSLISDFLRQIRYLFGPLPYSVPETLCTQDLITDITTPLNTTMNTTTLYGTQISKHIDKTISFISLPTLLILSLILATPILITILICHNSTCCLRRRADRAARREERRARAAYKSAARRLRWRRWFESWGILFSNHSPTASYAHIHDLSPISGDSESPNSSGPLYPHSRLPSGNDEPGPNTTIGIGTNILDTEIWNFRQALEYVGDLIRIPNPNRERDLESGYPLPDTGREQNSRRDASRPRRSRAASTAGLSTVVSLRTVTMSITDTDTDTDMEVEGTLSESCVTLDTLHSETPPPSYHP
ncbi:hypothetical protein BJX63DRAFT_380511 [Aspergillus granulosus]|uniref:Uncharacterized protein n=1 Tax=Aspergillus granulosus TaxID=176169 RepID=A0ABR4HXW5_9EURO